MDARNLLLVLLLVSIDSLCFGSDLTRASGMLNYPEPSREPSYGGGSRQNQQQYPSYQQPQHIGGGQTASVRIALTRNISHTANSDRLRAPEVSYFGAIGMGSPAKMFNVVFDTRASETWLPYYNWFPFANNLHYGDGYNCKESSTCRALKREFTVEYRNTKMSGETYEDALTLYEDMQKDDAQLLPGRQLSFAHTFLAIDDAGDGQFRYKPYDGVVGLAPVAQSSTGTQALLLCMQQGLMQQGQLVQQGSPNGPMDDAYLQEQRQSHSRQMPFLLIFGLWFNSNQNSRHGAELTLGGIDENRFSGDIFYHKLTSWFEWQVPVAHVMLGSLVVSCPGGCYASFDTGANSIVGPREDVEGIYSQLEAHYDQGSNLWLVDCQRVDQYPTMMVRIDDTPYTLLPRHYIKLFKFRDQIVCHLAIKPWDQSNWLLGTSFIGAYYTVFDFANRRVGLASPRG